MKIQTLPRPLAVGFVKNCRAYHDEKDHNARRAIALSTLRDFRFHYPNVRIWEVLELFDKAPAALGMARR